MIAGMGEGLGMALCTELVDAGFLVAGLSRSAADFPKLGDQYLPLHCDLSNQQAVNSAITEIESAFGQVTVYIHNAARLFRSSFLQTPSDTFRQQWEVTCLGAVHGFQRVIPNMLKAKNGTILVTAATASTKAGSNFSAFASAKFALRGLTQSLAREYSPQGIHIAHIIVDGSIWGTQARSFAREKHQCLSPQSVAKSYLHMIEQHHSAWTHELDLRPDIEAF